MENLSPSKSEVNLDRVILADALSEIRTAHDCLLMEHPGQAMQHLRAVSDRIFRHLKDAGVEVAG